MKFSQNIAFAADDLDICGDGLVFVQVIKLIDVNSMATALILRRTVGNRFTDFL